MVPPRRVNHKVNASFHTSTPATVEASWRGTRQIAEHHECEDFDIDHFDSIFGAVIAREVAVALEHSLP